MIIIEDDETEYANVHGEISPESNHDISKAYKINYKEGKIYSRKTSMAMKSWKVQRKYHQVQVDGKKRLVHRIVWSNYYKQDIPPQHDVHHINHDTNDNGITNLMIIQHDKHHLKHA